MMPVWKWYSGKADGRAYWGLGVVAHPFAWLGAGLLVAAVIYAAAS